MSIEALKQALEFVERNTYGGDDVATLITALRTAIEQAEKQDCDFCNHPLYAGTKCKNCGREAAALVQEPKQMNGKQPPASWNTPAAQRQWVGLTDEEYEKTIRDNMLLQMNFAGIRDDIEAKLREKNGGQA